MTRRILDVHSKAKESFAARLSNFEARPFVLDGLACASIEGFLQSLKTMDQSVAQVLRGLSGVPAFKSGQAYNNWKNRQKLFWNGVPVGRQELAYQNLLDRAYDAQFEQNPAMAQDLLLTVGFELRHLMGKHDSRDTVLTEAEYIRQLNRLRWRALDGENIDVHAKRSDRLRDGNVAEQPSDLDGPVPAVHAVDQPTDDGAQPVDQSTHDRAAVDAAQRDSHAVTAGTGAPAGNAGGHASVPRARRKSEKVG